MKERTVKNPSLVERLKSIQELTENTKRRAPKPENAEKRLFSDILRCGNCGRKMYYHTNTINKDIHFFVCSDSVSDYRGKCGPGRHYVRADAIEQIVSLELKRLAEVLVYDEGTFVDILAKKTNKDMLAEKKYLEGELQKSIVRNEKVLKLYEKIFEDNAEGKVTDEMFMALSHKYEIERMDLKAKISDIRKQLGSLENQQMGILTDNSIEEMMSADKPNQRETLKIPTERLQGKIPNSLTKAQAEDYVVKAVEYYHRYLQRQKENSR